MNTCSSLGGRDVNDEVANLAVEVVLVRVPVGTVTTWDIGIGIDQAHTLEVRSGLEDRHVQWVTDELGVVVLNDGLADHVSAGREVDERGCCGGRVASLAATIAVSDDLVDDFSVIGRTVTLGSELLDVTEDLVRCWVGVERSLALALD